MPGVDAAMMWARRGYLCSAMRCRTKPPSSVAVITSCMRRRTLRSPSALS